MESHPKIGDNIELATVLRDAGAYLLNNAVQLDAIPLLESTETICLGLLEAHPRQASSVLADALGTLQLYKRYMGI